MSTDCEPTVGTGSPQLHRQDATAGITPDIRARAWVFTLFTKEEDELLEVLQGEAFDAACGQWEVCPKTNRTHFQGCLRFENARTWTQVRRMLPAGAHIEKCKDWRASINYCSKEETRMPETEPFFKNCSRFVPTKAAGRKRPGPPAALPKVKDPLEGKRLYKWQAVLKETLGEDPDDRKIIWIWEQAGRTGKSAFVKHWVLENRETTALAGGKASDAMHGIVTMLEAGKEPGVIFFDIPRTMESYVSYQSIEQLKNGCFFSPKYESKTVVYNTPHVVVFANFAPDYDKLSGDRWDVLNIERGRGDMEPEPVVVVDTEDDEE